jgi:hypothetical protein
MKRCAQRWRADEDDLELLYSRYPSTEYEISSIDIFIKDEEEENTISKTAEHSASRPKTYKVTITMRDPQQQVEFRAGLLDHYKKCIISGKLNPILIDAAHIMPFKQVGSRLETGILLRKELHWLWDRYEISINPQTWIIHLSKKLQDDEDYSKYHMFKLLDETIRLLKVADFELLKQHHNKFMDKINGVKKSKTTKASKEMVAIDKSVIIIKRLSYIIKNELWWRSHHNIRALPGSLLLIRNDNNFSENDINIISFIKKLSINRLGFIKFDDIKGLPYETIALNLKNELPKDFEKELDLLLEKNLNLRRITNLKSKICSKELDRKAINNVLKMGGLYLDNPDKKYKIFKLLWTANVDNNFNFKKMCNHDGKKWQDPFYYNKQ